MNSLYLQIMFDSIFHTYLGAPILCCIATDLGDFLCKVEIFCRQ